MNLPDQHLQSSGVRPGKNLSRRFIQTRSLHLGDSWRIETILRGRKFQNNQYFRRIEPSYVSPGWKDIGDREHVQA
jgi:hypothetical protein